MINWNEVSPEDISLEDLETAKEEDSPISYTGSAWRACFLMYHEDYKKEPEKYLQKDG